MRSAGFRKLWILAVGLVCLIATGAMADSLLNENFNDGVANDWSPGLGTSGANWQVVNGEFVRVDTGGNVEPYMYYQGVGASAWSDYLYECDFEFLNGSNLVNFIGFAFRVQDLSHFYCIQFADTLSSPYVMFYEYGDGGIVDYDFVSHALEYNEPHHISISALGSDFIINLDGSLLYSFSDTSYSHGTIGLGAAYIMTAFDNVQVTSAPVPEPATLSILALGMAGMGLRRFLSRK